LDRYSPSTTSAVKGSTSMVHPPTLHGTRILLCSLKAKASYLHRPPEKKKYGSQTPVQELHARSTSSTGLLRYETT
jgi:hypothetical protein